MDCCYLIGSIALKNIDLGIKTSHPGIRLFPCSAFLSSAT